MFLLRIVLHFLRLYNISKFTLLTAQYINSGTVDVNHAGYAFSCSYSVFLQYCSFPTEPHRIQILSVGTEYYHKNSSKIFFTNNSYLLSQEGLALEQLKIYLSHLLYCILLSRVTDA